MKHHDRPWKCSIQDCAYAEGGFLSRKMRDDHYRDHIATGSREIPYEEDNAEADEIQPLLFDLVKADKVDVVRNLLGQLKALPQEIQAALRECAASFGSPAMIDLIRPYSEHDFPADAMRHSIRAANIDLFKHLLSRSKNCSGVRGRFRRYSDLLIDVLITDSEEIFEEWERYIDVDRKKYRSGSVPYEERYTDPHVIRATAGHPGRENLLINVWEKIGILKSLDRLYLGSAVVNVASTTCSVKLAKYFIDHGAEVDFRRSDFYLTALHHAARKNSAAAAEMMKYLLLQGADPELKAGRAHVRICDEKGARGIAQWLGMSWDELVAKTKEDREKMAGKGKDSKEEQEMGSWGSST
jgi:Ankyrin repeat